MSRKRYFLIFLLTVFFNAFESGAFEKKALNNGWIFETGQAKIRVSVFTEDIFRITVVPLNDTLPGISGVFIRPGDFKPGVFELFDEDKSFGIMLNNAGLEVSNKGSFGISLKNKDGKSILSEGTFLFNNQKPIFWDVSFSADADERNYGVGNPLMGQSGGLIKISERTDVGNGITKIPFLWSTKGYGFLVDYEEKGVEWKKTSDGHNFKVPGKIFDLYIILGDTPYEILDSYTYLTGRPPIAPLWSFGFMMSRWGYKDFEDIKEKWYKFREKKIPIDVFIYDYDWYENDWEWNNKMFPDPENNIKEANSIGVKIAGIRKPRVENGENYNFAKKQGWILKGTRNDIDFSVPEVRKWWWEKHIRAFSDGMSGWWNDEAEQSMTEYHYMIKSQRDGMLELKPGMRVWTINRAFSPGMQRLGSAVWTGDIFSSWDSLKSQPGTLLNYSNAGMVYSSQDIGGFIGLPSSELYVRWIQQGVFIPVMRAHSQQYSDRWPWAFGADAEKAVKKAIELRYRLIPYIYSCARQAYETGAPLMRPVFFEFPDEPITFDMEDEWFFGREILSAPVLGKNGKRSVYLPKGIWYEFDSGNIIVGPSEIEKTYLLDEIPVYVREGSIVVLGPVVQHTDEKDETPLEVHIYSFKDAEFTLYQDDGKTYNYENGEYNTYLLSWNQKNLNFSVKQEHRGYTDKKRYLIKSVIIHGAVKPDKVYLNSKVIPKEDWDYDVKSKNIIISLGNLKLDENIEIQLSKPLANENSIENIKRVALKSKDAFARLSALKSLIENGFNDEKFYLKCLKDKNDNVRMLSLYGLDKIKSDSDIFIDIVKKSNGPFGVSALKYLEKHVYNNDKKAYLYFVENLKKKTDIKDTIKILSYKCNEKEVMDEFKSILKNPNSLYLKDVLQALKSKSKDDSYFNLIVTYTFSKNSTIADTARKSLAAYSNDKLEKYFGNPITHWKVTGPFDNSGGKGFSEQYPPEKEINIDKSYQTLLGSSKWKDVMPDSSGIVDLLSLYPEHPENTCAYACSIFNAKKDGNYELWLGSDDGAKVWLNGEVAWSNDIGRALTKDQDKIKIKVKQGENKLLIKICQGSGAWAYTARFVDPKGNLNNISY